MQRLTTLIDILRRHAEYNSTLAKDILTNYVKPAFQGNVHPSLNVNTGRRLPERLGGALSQQDYLENQSWKTANGLYDVISWCLKHAEVRCSSRSLVLTT